MIIFPAIDLYGGKAVRLLRGAYEEMTVYSEDPPAVARDFAAAGAEYAHLVDLEGARDGTTPNFSLVARIAAESGLKVEVGGGIRSGETAERYLSAGVFRVILGTAAAEDPALLERLAARFPGRIAVGVDIKDGFVAVRGWREASALTAEELLLRRRDAGISDVIVTDISRDGAMRGSNTALYEKMTRAFPEIGFVASGGVSSHEDLAALRLAGCRGAIVGKAYYTGAVDLARAIRENA